MIGNLIIVIVERCKILFAIMHVRGLRGLAHGSSVVDLAQVFCH